MAKEPTTSKQTLTMNCGTGYYRTEIYTTGVAEKALAASPGGHKHLQVPQAAQKKER